MGSLSLSLVSIESNIFSPIFRKSRISSSTKKNICPEPIDAAEPDKRSAEQEKEEYFESAPRKWLKEFVGPNGPMIDICRKFHPTRSGMYTCKSFLYSLFYSSDSLISVVF